MQGIWTYIDAKAGTRDCVDFVAMDVLDTLDESLCGVRR
jgi:hypothetical protein